MEDASTDIILVDSFGSPSEVDLPPVFGGELPTTQQELRSVLQRAMDAWLRKAKSEKSRVAYRTDVEQFLSFLGINPADVDFLLEVRPDDVANWRDYLLKYGGRPDKTGAPTKAKNATVARKLTSLRSFFSYLQRCGYRGGNPAHPDFVDAPEMPTTGMTPEVPPKQVVELLNAPDLSTPKGVRDRGVMAMLAYMALRVEEIHLLDVGNIYRDGAHLVCRIDGKGKTERKGVIPPAAEESLEAWLKVAEIRDEHHGPLFRPLASPRGKGRDGFKPERLSIRPLQRMVEKYCRELCIDRRVSIHSFRVTAATEADRAGVPLKQIQHWLGHKDPRTTERYIRTGQELDSSPAYVLQTRYSNSDATEETQV